MHSPNISPCIYTNPFNIDVVEIPLNTSVIMKQVFDFSPEQFYAHLQQTMSAHKCYRLSFHNDDNQQFTIRFPSKGMFIDGHVVSGIGTTELYLSATSPICVISAEHEQSILTDLVSRLHSTIHQPVPQRTSPARRRYSFKLRSYAAS
jgi:hypothetical protein